MRNAKYEHDRPVVIVLGCDEIGSAVAHAAHCAGYAVILIDGVDPGWARRGNSYVDAWYVGGATLEHVDACFCASARSIGPVLARTDMVAATTWSWQGVAQTVMPRAVIETRQCATPRATCRPPLLENVLTIGVRSRTVGGWPADVVISGAPASDSIPDSTTRIGARRNPVRILVPHTGRFRTRLEITDWVDEGEVVGEVGAFAAIAPASGVLIALAARGARLVAGQLIAEIDTTATIGAAFGIMPDARRIALEVTGAIRRGAIAPRAHAPVAEVETEAA